MLHTASRRCHAERSPGEVAAAIDAVSAVHLREKAAREEKPAQHEEEADAGLTPDGEGARDGELSGPELAHEPFRVRREQRSQLFVRHDTIVPRSRREIKRSYN